MFLFDPDGGCTHSRMLHTIKSICTSIFHIVVGITSLTTPSPFEENMFENMFETFQTLPSIDLEDLGDMGVLEDLEDLGDILDDIIADDISIPHVVVEGVPCLIVMGTPLGYPVAATEVFSEVAVPQAGPLVATFSFIPKAPLKSKNTDMATLVEIDAYIKERTALGDDMALAQQDYMAFGDDGGASLSARDLDRNKDMALVLKMVSGLYGISLSKMYHDIGKLTYAPCVSCGEHRPQRGALLCYYCSKSNTSTMMDLMLAYISKYALV